MRKTYDIELEGEAATEAFAAAVADATRRPVCIFLSGQLAAGKTTFARGFLRQRGHRGAVKSPTFTLVESYHLSGRFLHHFDLYRISDPEELEYIGLDEYFEGGNDCLVEWPERGFGVLPVPDLEIDFQVFGKSRKISLASATSFGEEVLERIHT